MHDMRSDGDSVFSPFTGYKIMAKILAIRLKNVLPHIINDDQTGYLKTGTSGKTYVF